METASSRLLGMKCASTSTLHTDGMHHDDVVVVTMPTLRRVAWRLFFSCILLYHTNVRLAHSFQTEHGVFVDHRCRQRRTRRATTTTVTPTFFRHNPSGVLTRTQKELRCHRFSLKNGVSNSRCQEKATTALFGTDESLPLIDDEFDDWEEEEGEHGKENTDKSLLSSSSSSIAPPSAASVTLQDLSAQMAQTQKQLLIQQQQIQQILLLLSPGGTSPMLPQSTPAIVQPDEDSVDTIAKNDQYHHQQRSARSAFVSASSKSPSSVVPLRVMVFIDGTWAYYSLFERGFKCPLNQQYGMNWHNKYRFDWDALPRIICQTLRDSSWLTTKNEPGRPLEIARMSVFTSFKADTLESSLRFRLFQDMRAAGYDVHQMETVGKSEKCVDIQLAVDMLHFATVPNSYDIAVLLSGDKDFMPALLRVRQKGRQVAIVSMKTGCNRALYETDGLKDYDMIWLEDHFDELIVPKDSMHVNSEDESTAINPLVLVHLIWDFIEASGCRLVSSRDLGRYLKSLQVEGRSLLREIKSRHIGLNHFLRHSHFFDLIPGPIHSYMVGLTDNRGRREELRAELEEEERKLLKTLQKSIPSDKQTAYYFTLNGDPALAGVDYHYFVPEYKVFDVPDEKEVVDYSTFTVTQLKELCRERGLPVSGVKSALVARLENNVKEQAPEQNRLSNTNSVKSGISDHLLGLITEYLHARGGQASSRDVGRYLAANKRRQEGSTEILSANQELKRYFGGLSNFVASHKDVFGMENDYVDGNDETGRYAFKVMLNPSHIPA